MIRLYFFTLPYNVYARAYWRTAGYAPASMLQQLKWNTLLERREKARATLFYKIINGLDNGGCSISTLPRA